MERSMDHIAVVVRDLDKALSFYRDALGLDVIERREVPEEQVEVASLSMGYASIELVQPLDAESGVARFLEKRGEGLHHICLTVDDITGALEQLRDAGADLITDEPRVGSDGRRYAFIHPKSAHGVLLELYEIK
ncbi:MAG: methylmalonyl-CoA epimerase [Anaerolineae bacterium]|nr:methylmalonyl-CoA epimerase [Anaerolineae bacterium]